MKRPVALATRVLVVALSVALTVVPALAAADELALVPTAGQPASAVAGPEEKAESFHAFSQLKAAEQIVLTPLTDVELAALEGGTFSYTLFILWCVANGYTLC